MTRALALLAALALSACASDPPVVTKIVRELPASPSPDLLADPTPPVTAGAKNIGEALEIIAIAEKNMRRQALGWIAWYAAAKRSVEGKE